MSDYLDRYSAAMNGGQAPQGAPAAGAPDFLAHFLQNIFGPAIAQQNQNQAGRLGLQRQSIFGRHLGMDGQPIANTPQTPLSFDQLRRSPTDVANAERQTFGSSFTAGDRAMPTQAAMSAFPMHLPQAGASGVQGANPAWMPEQGGYSMLNRATSTPQNPWSFGRMSGSYLPAGVQGPLPQAPRLF